MNKKRDIKKEAERAKEIRDRYDIALSKDFSKRLQIILKKFNLTFHEWIRKHIEDDEK